MHKRIVFLIRIVIALILIQTLRFKFTGHPDSIYIFSKVGLEPFGRIGIGIIELIAAMLLVIPKTIYFGALISFGVISGAIIMHLTILGIEVNNDHGILFYTAVLVFILSAIIIWEERKNIPFLNKIFLR
jgi:uncharacterized membrane protein YphA (DoxX/SURF4 family)